MRIDKIGEFGLIEKIGQWVKADASVVKGIGDDCAVIKYSKDKYLLFTCDAIIQDVDFRKSDDPYLVGRKAIGINISDIAAKGGEPKYALVSLGLPKNTSLAYVKKLYAGMNYWVRKFKINIVGGDISRAAKVSIDISLIGFVEKKNLVLRSTARENDIILVSGPLGGSIRAKHLKFTPRLKEARYLVKNFKLHAMIDISDGLIQDLGHILAESKKGAVLYDGLIPIALDARNLNEALNMGEDFELLFTLPFSEASRLCAKMKHYKAIGYIAPIKTGLALKDKNGKVRKVKAKGFRHF
ncbi:MAG: thiamine-phosphate kinase [Candidatus Omnitrophica bacterium]|nr:thiamine-phosphate kinase [Candidatus Omnitrophota bacterium]MDD5236298.1 thiamine-phosphate kinase [Candidatus Omnitrophota bacterium]MDD5611344.1 thiamine-phosphate kinase [Candidatus Omnitrophota bacterium]